MSRTFPPIQFFTYRGVRKTLSSLSGSTLLVLDANVALNLLNITKEQMESASGYGDVTQYARRRLSEYRSNPSRKFPIDAALACLELSAPRGMAQDAFGSLYVPLFEASFSCKLTSAEVKGHFQSAKTAYDAMHLSIKSIVSQLLTLMPAEGACDSEIFEAAKTFSSWLIGNHASLGNISGPLIDIGMRAFAGNSEARGFFKLKLSANKGVDLASINVAWDWFHVDKRHINFSFGPYTNYVLATADGALGALLKDTTYAGLQAQERADESAVIWTKGQRKRFPVRKLDNNSRLQAQLNSLIDAAFASISEAGSKRLIAHGE